MRKLEAQFYNWLDTDARRYEEPAALVDALAEHLQHLDFSIFRMSTLIPMLHPIVRAESILWHVNAKAIVREIHQDPQAADSKFRNGPLYTVHECASEVHIPITTVPEEDEYDVLRDLRQEGATDYLATPMLFSDGSIKALTFATKATNGFSPDDLSFLTSVAQRIAPLFEIHTLRRTARILMDTYVGSIAGERILDGEIIRGHGESIDAVIWFCDLQDFTSLSNSLSGDDMIELLNRFFGVLSSSIEKHDGQVLKFIGDAVLAVFPMNDEGDAAIVSKKALQASEMAIRGINALNDDFLAQEIKCGVVLHIGEVYFGNVGGERRLDFTVIGPAVNLASRIEGLTRSVASPVLLSKEFARHFEDSVEHVGDFEFKGFDGCHEIYAVKGTTFSPQAEKVVTTER